MRSQNGGDRPVSFAQRRLWFLDQLGAGSAFNVPIALRLTGRLDVGALEHGLNALIRRHETLRTSFAALDGEPLQRVAAQLDLALERVDSSTLEETAREAQLDALAREQAGRPFDLSIAPLLRAMLVALAGDEHVLLLTLHHIVTDGWSMEGPLLSDLSALYEAACKNQESSLPPLALQYGDHAELERDALQAHTAERQMSYWRGQLAGLEPLAIPTDRPRPALQTYRSEIHAFEIMSPEALCLAITQARALDRTWMVAPGAHRKDGWRVLELGLTRDAVGFSTAEAALSFGIPRSSAGHALLEHRRLLLADSHYCERAAEVLEQGLRITFGKSALSSPSGQDDRVRLLCLRDRA